MKKTKILIIEDNPHLQELYQMAFAGAGYEALLAPDGLTGITMAAESKPEVILLDLMMPNMDGFEVLDALRRNTSLESAVFITSNLNEPKNIDRALEAGATKFLKKADYTPHETVAQVEAYLQGEDAPESTSATEEGADRYYKVLLIEDNADQSELLTLALMQKHMQVSLATDGAEGISKALAEQPHVILLDLRMPNMDGFKVLETLHKEAHLAVPIIITSQLEGAGEQKKAKDLGAVDFLKKSEYTPEQIAERVLDYLEVELAV